MPMRLEFGRDPLAELEDAGHLELQEFMLGLARTTDRGRAFELQVKPFPGLSADVALRDDVRRMLILEECWNTFGNLGSSVRNTRRKVAELEEMAVAVAGEQGPYRVAACWIMRDVARNRALVERYPEIFRSTFTGDSRTWIHALTAPGSDPPSGYGCVWCDPRGRRLSPVILPRRDVVG
jgi:hypothetical protein